MRFVQYKDTAGTEILINIEKIGKIEKFERKEDGLFNINLYTDIGKFYFRYVDNKKTRDEEYNMLISQLIEGDSKLIKLSGLCDRFNI